MSEPNEQEPPKELQLRLEMRLIDVKTGHPVAVASLDCGAEDPRALDADTMHNVFGRPAMHMLIRGLRPRS